MVFPTPLGRSTVFAHLVPDVLHVAEDRKHLAAGAAVLGSKLTGEALAVAEAPVDDQRSQPRSVDSSSPWCFALEKSDSAGISWH